MLTVSHIEDDPVWGQIVANIAGKIPNVEYLGQKGSALEGLQHCIEKCPDVVLVDLWLPDTDGFQLAAKLRILPRPPLILFLSGRDDDLTLFRTWNGAAEGLIWKTISCQNHLAAGLAAVADGRRYFPEDVLVAIHRFRGSPEAFFKILTPREQSLMEIFVQGGSDDDIAGETSLSFHTVRTHRKKIMAKLNLHRTADLIRWGIERGFHANSGRRSVG